MVMTDGSAGQTAPPFYPAEALETHGITDPTTPGVYALALARPATRAAFEAAWADTYQVAPPDALEAAVSDAQRIAYVGAAQSLRDRLEDHVAGDVRQPGVLSVLDVTGLRAVWPYDDADRAFEREWRRANALAREHENTVCWCNGELVT